jgi:hypothetical protein
MKIVITEAEVRTALREEGYRNPTARQKRKMKLAMHDYAIDQRTRDIQDSHRFKMIDGVCVDTYAVKAIP